MISESHPTFNGNPDILRQEDLYTLIAFVWRCAQPQITEMALVFSDSTGRHIRAVEPIHLSAYHRSLDLERFGMSGAVLYKSMSGRVGVRLQSGVRLQAAGSTKPAELIDVSLDSTVSVWDNLLYPAIRRYQP
jgi:hypothetical protein